VKKYRFGLNSVLRLRHLEEQQARASMLEQQRAVDEATEVLDARLAAIGAARPMPGRRQSSRFRDERDQLERHTDAVAAARASEANALAALRSARQVWEETAKRVRALERLDDRQRAAWLLDATRNAQAATDEIAQNYHDRDRR